MRLMASILGLLLAATPGHGNAAPAPAEPPQAAATAGVTRVTAAALARVVAPMDVLLPVELEQARKAILALPTLDEDAKQLEQEYPGLYSALWIAVEPEMRRQTVADYPSFWALLEQLYIDRLTEREAQAALTFYKSPTGQKLMHRMYGGFDAAPLFADILKSDSAVIGASQMQAVTDAARANALQGIGPDDKAALMGLVSEINLEKFRALGVETQRVTLEWVNKDDPAGEAKLGKIMEEAMEKYMESHPPK